MIVVFSGWRGWTDEKFVFKMMRNFEYEFRYVTKIRVGDCPTGVDMLVRKYLLNKGVAFTEWKANWDVLKRYAGPARNREMLTGKTLEHSLNRELEGPPATLLIALPEPGSHPSIGSGTWGCMGEAWRNQVEVSIPQYPNM